MFTKLTIKHNGKALYVNAFLVAAVCAEGDGAEVSIVADQDGAPWTVKETAEEVVELLTNSLRDPDDRH